MQSDFDRLADIGKKLATLASSPEAHQSSTPSSNSIPNSSKLHPNLSELIRLLKTISKEQKDGHIEIKTQLGQTFNLFFRLGRFAWASDTVCRFRRWDRLLRQSCPDTIASLRRLQGKQPDLFWEYKILSRLIHQGLLERQTAESLVQTNIEEVLFDILHAAANISDVVFHIDKATTIPQPILVLSISRTLSTAQENYQDWVGADLVTCSPNWSPVICSYELLRSSVSEKTYQVVSSLVNGELSLRDLALLLPGGLLSITKTLLSYEQQGTIEFCMLEDFPPPWPVENLKPPVEANALQDQPLILCVDDSPQNCRILEKIIVPAGYQYFSTNDSIQALPLIIEKQPDLLFIDLVMPIINGHELCGKIRQISQFKDTPIVILTSNTGVVDRLRSKMTGATEFLSKPAQRDVVLNVVKRYLDQG